MLIKLPEFTKRIRENILAHLTSPDVRLPKYKGAIQDNTGQDGEDEEDNNKEKNQREDQQAVIQTLNFLSLPGSPSVEDKTFRENLANFYHDDYQGKSLYRIGIPYLIFETELPRRHGNLKSSYPLLQGNTAEITEYIANSTQEYFDQPIIPILTKKQAIKKKDQKVYPFSAINITLPWHASTDHKPAINLPSPEQVATMARKLTEQRRSQLTLFVSGPEAEASQYFATLRRELSKNLGTRNLSLVSEITVEEGYITADKETTYSQLQQFLNMTSLQNDQKKLEESRLWIMEECEAYIDQTIKVQRLEKVWGATKSDSELFQGIQDELNTARQAVKKFELKWSALRRASQPLSGTEERSKIVDQENATDKSVRALARAITKCEKDAEKSGKADEQTLSNIAASKKESTAAYQVIASLWFDLQKNMPDKLKGVALAYEPVTIRTMFLQNRDGFLHPTTWRKPINIQQKSWNANEDLPALKKALEKQPVLETHLGVSYPTDTYADTTTLEYPTDKAEIIRNPQQFQPLPEELVPRLAHAALDPNASQLPVRIDTRLAPRPNLATELLLENDNLQIQLYNPVAGRPTGLKDATLWRPIITKKGVAHIQDVLAPFGYQIQADAAVYNLAERKVKQAEKCLAPNYPLTPYEALAYFENGPRVAETTIVHPDTGEPLWIEGKTYHITPSWKRQTMLVDHSVEEEHEEAPVPVPDTVTDAPGDDLEAEKEKAEANDIITLGKNADAQKIENASRIQTLTERRINFGFATFIAEAEGNQTYEIRETVTRETISMEKERIALEIDHILSRIDGLEEKVERTKVENRELKKLEAMREEKLKELDSWAPMLEDFLQAFPPEAPALSSEIYGEQIQTAMKQIYGRFAPFIKNQESDTETSIKDYQLKWAAVGAIKRGHANSSNPGAGKAQPLTSKVLTQRGWIKMGDITLEDQVFTPDGKRANVIGIFPQGKIPIYEMELKDGRKVRACKDHLWKVYNKRWLAQDKKHNFPIPADQLGCKIVDTKKITQLLETSDRLYLPLLAEIDYKTAKLPIEPYLLGALLGDGGITHHITFTNADADVIQECRKSLHPDYRIKKVKSNKYGYGLSHKDGVWQQPTGSRKKPKNPYWESLKELGLAQHKIPEKFIPEIYKTADKTQRLRLIQGLMDTDGCVDQNGSLHFHSTSKQLASDFLEIIWSLGGTGFITPKQTYYTHLKKRRIGTPSYVVNFRHNKPKQFVLCERKNIRISDDYQYEGSIRNEIISIKPVGKEEAQCILIDHPDHLYITDNYVVTHNTIMSLMSTWHMGHHYNWVICPTIAMKTWAKEIERVGLYHEMVGYKLDENGEWTSRPSVYEHMRELRQRFHKRIRSRNRLGKIEPEYYIISAESVSLGGEGNRTYSPWHFDYRVSTKLEKLKKALEDGKLELPAHWTIHSEEEKALRIRVWSDRPDTAKEIKKYGFQDFLRPVKFYRAVKECPRCGASAPTWTKHGHCNSCKHSHSGITRQKSQWDAAKHSPKVPGNHRNLTATPPTLSSWEGEKTSQKQYPLYKMMGKHVGCKIIDEVHNWTNFHSQHGAALLQVKTKDTIVLSGTLCKTHISELEPSLCQIYEANSGEFPYSPWGMDLFKEQFQTREIENIYRTRTTGLARNIRRRTVEKIVPEASNLTKLRALLHGILCSVGESEMERVWNIQPIQETIRYVELQERNAAIYQEWERLLQEAYAECKTEHEKVGMLRQARGQLTNLAYACDGPEKLDAAIAWIQEGMAQNARSVIVGPSTRFYTMLCKTLRDRNIPFMSMGNLDPEKRFDFLNKFRDSNCPNFVSRIRLVNVNFNQLTCCSRILFTGIDPSPSAIRQMQKRLNRIGQTQNVHCTFLISQLPIPTGIDIQAEILQTIDALESGGTIEAEGGGTRVENNDSLAQRPSSYEERLFALVLRRETAIKQTLQQADRQRDPQELYEMLKDRQTLNQLLQDIVENTRSDTGVADIIKAMAEKTVKSPLPPTPEIIEVETEVEPVSEIEPNPGTETPAEPEGRGTTPAETRTKPGRRRQTKPAEPLGPPPLPEGLRFTWIPVRSRRSKTSGVLQGEFFSL